MDYQASTQSSMHSYTQSEDDSRSSSIAPSARKSSLASMAMRLVAGGAISSREAEARGREARAAAAAAAAAATAASASAGTTPNEDRGRAAAAVERPGRPASAQPGASRSFTTASTPRGRHSATNIPTVRPATTTTTTPASADRWDSMSSSPPRPGAAAAAADAARRQESYGPVEMDTILPPDAQPPTLARLGKNYCYDYPNGEFLTDRFGFIYDQRRKKRQREAASRIQQSPAAAVPRTDLLSAAAFTKTAPSSTTTPTVVNRPGSPDSDRAEAPAATVSDGVSINSSGSRWQDYLAVATYPTELLAHTPAISARRGL
jgi:hypothetical protein